MKKDRVFYRALAGQFLFPLLIALAFVAGCGVKGDPLPPEHGPVLGRGEPVYRQNSQQKKSKTYLRTEDGEDEREEAEDNER